MRRSARNAKDDVRIVGRYALHDAIASGGMATVHFGRLLGPVGFSRTVAIKRLHAQFAADPEFVSMFLDEARLAARIRHPNVIPTLDVVATSGELFLVMEYVPGESLARLARTEREKGETLPLRIVTSVVAGMLHGLHAAHEAKSERGAPLGIVHRDISPQNVLVGTDGVARVLDFGVAKAAGRMQTTREGQIKGKLSYMSPEQLRGKPVNRQCDIYAAGVLLWELLVGERLFSADNEGALLALVLEGNVAPPSHRRKPSLRDEVRPEQLQALDAVVLRALATAPEDRFTTAREMAMAVERAVQPAMASEVSEWIEANHADILTRRAELVAEIESSASALRPDLADGGTVQEVMQSPHQPQETTGGDRARITQPPYHQASSKSQMSSISVASASHFPGAPKTNRVAILVAAVAIATLAIMLTLIFTRVVKRDARVTSTVTAAQPTVGNDSPSIPVIPPVPPPQDPPPVVTATSSAPIVTAPPIPPQTPRPWRSPHPAATPREPQIATTPTPKPNNECNPPYTWDKDGLKHIKPNCL